ncbi:rho GTPase-activating protein 31-like [Gallus gallus]|uniref:rho GTPase-activating protein 31-like n=1 Tax=Gallus gallus TaxID=9031 RepID=UPI001AE78E5C|nr:rho GTPase-activating protein 31-like [Gallus gallus]
MGEEQRVLLPFIGRLSSARRACSSAAGLSGWDVTGAAAEAGLESGAQLTAGTCSCSPQVLQSCAEFIEQHGVVQGIYRLSGVASKIQKLRHEFESEQIPELSVRDVHSVSSLCKMYFRELPTPLLTEQLYGKFSVSTRQWLSCPSSLGLLAWPVAYTPPAHLMDAVLCRYR